MADRRPEEVAVGVLAVFLLGLTRGEGKDLATSRANRDTGVLVTTTTHDYSATLEVEDL